MASTIPMPKVNKNFNTFQPETVPHRSSFQKVSLPKRVENNKSITNESMTAASAASILVKPRTSSPSLAHAWREIHGSNNWEGLIEPLNPYLKQEIIRYGHFVTACYKAFDLDPSSKRHLNCKYGKRRLFREVGMENAGYEVTKYIYATPDINIPIQNGSPCCGRWIGYIAVSSDGESKRLGRRDILVTFRGTVTNPEWIANLMSSLAPARLDPHDPRLDVKVESGFLSLYTSDESKLKFGLQSCREQLLSEISALLKRYKREEISITIAGHSMGSSLGQLLAYDIAELGLNRSHSDREIPISVFSFGGPRVGNSGFKERCEELGVKVLRIVNVNDPITKLPGFVFNENFRVLGGRYEFPWSCSCYAHVGVELTLDFFNIQNPSCVHDLEAYISLLKYPPRRVDQAKPRLENLLSRARDLLLVSAQNFDKSSWWNAASNMVNMVQSQRT